MLKMIPCLFESQILLRILCLIWQLCFRALGDMCTCVGLATHETEMVWLCGTMTEHQCDGDTLTRRSEAVGDSVPLCDTLRF